MLFRTLAQAFFAIQQESSRNKMTELLAQVLTEATAHEAQLLSYLALGVLRAPYRGNQFNFAEKSMVKVVASINAVEIAQMTATIKQVGDIGAAVLASPWQYQDTGLSIEEVHTRLEELMSVSGAGSQEERSQMVIALLKEVDVLSASFIIRIILGTMRLGFSDMTLIDALSWMVKSDKSLKTPLENAYNVCADIGLIASILKRDGIEAVKELQPTLGIPIRPAAAERAESPRAILDKIGPCVAQPKLDGFRLQIHIDMRNKEPHIWFYSRNLQDMSSMFPDLKEALLQVKAQTLIAEGEAIVYDEATQSFLPFQETVKRKRKHGIEEVAETLPLRLFLFDILYINGENVLSKTHEERRSLMVNYFGEYPSEVVQVTEEKLCTGVQELTDYFNEQITHGLEGLVVKRPDAPYQPGKRNFNWIKLKRHQEGHLDDTIDAVIIGYYAGRGKRASFGIGAFLVAVYNEELDRFETVAKIGTGLTDEEWIELKKKCDSLALAQQPVRVSCAPELKPDVWVAPTYVAVVLADEITQSPLHTAGKTDTTVGLALRFPRFMGYSVDKSPEQATSVKELRRLFELQFKAT
jgi:DNA ligase 1